MWPTYRQEKEIEVASEALDNALDAEKKRKAKQEKALEYLRKVNRWFPNQYNGTDLSHAVTDYLATLEKEE